MLATKRTEVFDVDIQSFYDVVIDYAAYHEFVDNVHKVRVIKQYDDRIRVKFFIHVIKDFDYTLDLYHDSPRRVWWKFVRGDLFKTMDGSWDLRKRGKNKTEVTYTLDVQPKILAPKLLVRSLVSTSLPSMMRAFAERAQELKEG